MTFDEAGEDCVADQWFNSDVLSQVETEQGAQVSPEPSVPTCRTRGDQGGVEVTDFTEF